MLRVGAGVAVVALHAAVVAALFWAPSSKPEISLPEPVTVHFVEIAPDIQEFKAPEAETPPAPEQPVVEPEPEPEPVVEPEPEPEPVVEPEPEPEPEPEVEPEPEPEPPVADPMPEPPKPKPKPPPPKPKPKPQPPKPKPQPPKPQPTPKPPVELPPSGSSADSDKQQGPQSAPQTDGPRLVGKVDYDGRQPMPVYPRMSANRGEEGRVIVRVLINVNGRVDRATLQRSSGFERLDKAALVAARKGRFKPYTVNGVPQPALTDIPFDFALRKK